LSKDYQTLLLTGDLTIKSSTQTKQRVEEALAGAAVGTATLLVDIADEHDADLTLAQLLLSAKKTAERVQVVFRLKRPVAGSLLAVLTRGGLIGAGTPDNEFWLHEGVTQ
jgi:hypothetical protein